MPLLNVQEFLQQGKEAVSDVEWILEEWFNCKNVPPEERLDYGMLILPEVQKMEGISQLVLSMEVVSYQKEGHC